MDWGKSKNVLIFALLVTNLLLLYFVVRDRMATADGTLTKAFQNETVTMLEEKGIKLNTKIPNKNMKLHSLSVEFEKKTSEELNESFFSNKAAVLPLDDNKVTLEYKNEKISILNNRRVFYENNRKPSTKKIHVKLSGNRLFFSHYKK